MTSPALRYARAKSGLTFRPDSSCVLWLPGQDDPQSAVIRDRSGNGNNGAITGATWVQLSSGLWCLNFDGDDSVNCGHDSSFDMAIELTIEFWLYGTAESGSLVNKRQSGVGGWVIGFEYTNLYARVETTGGLCYWYRDYSVYLNSWHYLRMTYKAGVGIYTYIDEVQGGPYTQFTDPIGVSTNNVIIGAALTGKIALLKIYNAVVAGHYNQERSLFGV